jgi:hypothetical protein
LLQELAHLKREAAKDLQPDGPSPHDVLRRKYLRELSEHTGRAAIVYATCWLENRPEVGGDALSLTLGDKQGFMEAVSNISESELDLILTSPGGDPDAAGSIMKYLRTRFNHIRAVVPVAAMSAATMMALACDEILMGKHSQLGPIDPQLTVITPEGPRSSPGQAILDQFERAKEECRDPKNIGAWMPLLRALAPGLIAECKHSQQRAEFLVAEQLAAHMFRGNPKKAKHVASWFADFSQFKSHSHPVTLDDAIEQGLAITKLEDDQVLQDRVLSVHHAVRHTFNDTGTTKLIENHHGRAYLTITNPVVIEQGPPEQPAGPPNLNRQQRREAERKEKKKRG